MAITLADFNKIWASTSPLTPYSFTESNYKQGWNFVGATPPARQMWDSVQKQNDEKMQFIVNNMLVPVDVDENSASGNYYNTSVPSGKMFSNFTQIGGKTLAWNQLVDSGTSSVTLISGHKYYTLISGSASIQTGAGSAISVTGGTDKVSDLTLMFGSGNEPSVADFQALFPNYASEGYNAGTLLSAGTDKVISKDSSNNVVATMPIPSAVQALEGYGWSAGSVYNYVDFERKVFVKRVGAVDLGSLSWNYSTAQGGRFNSSTTLNDAKAPIAKGIPSVCGKYVTLYGDESALTASDVCIQVCPLNLSASKYVYIKDSTAGTDPSAFKTAMAGVMLYYELATPVETDISDLLGADGIACESGGSLTFSNSNGDNYRIPVSVNLDWLDGTDGLMTVQDKGKLEVAYKASEVDNSIPAGVVQAFAGNNTPNGWLLCDGSAVSRVMYSALFNVIGTTYGAGDGSTTFNLPNLADKFIQGSATSGTEKTAGLPEITAFGEFRCLSGGANLINGLSGSFSDEHHSNTTTPVAAASDTPGSQGFTFKASSSSSVYGNSTTVQPPALTMRYIIKT